MYRLINIIGIIVAINFLQPTVAFANSKYFYNSAECSRLDEIRGQRLIKVEETFQNLLEYSGLKGNYYLCPIKSNRKAYATNANSIEGNIIIKGQYIAYNSTFIKDLQRKTGYWGVAGVLAHELAHHILGHTRNGHGSRPDTELEADYIAGMLMELSGASLANSATLPSQPFLANGGRTHPDGPDRIRAFKNGWYKGCEKKPTAQCPNYKHTLKNFVDDPNYKETAGFLRLLNQAEQLKGRKITSSYCHLYTNVSIRQAQRNKRFKCGYLVDAYKGSRWSTNRNKQYAWCMKISAYATEKETLFREKKLKSCQAR